jgi:ATP-dependent helicase/nuclease subunit B
MPASLMTRAGSSGEESRFIKQLEFETSCRFRHMFYSRISQLILQPRKSIEVSKSGPVLDKLRTYLKRNSESKYDKKISASAFTDYVSCSLKFFFGKIAGLAEPKDLPDEIGPHTVGTMLHTVMENFYRIRLGRK